MSFERVKNYIDKHEPDVYVIGAVLVTAQIIVGAAIRLKMGPKPAGTGGWVPLDLSPNAQLPSAAVKPVMNREVIDAPLPPLEASPTTEVV